MSRSINHLAEQAKEELERVKRKKAARRKKLEKAMFWLDKDYGTKMYVKYKGWSNE